MPYRQLKILMPLAGVIPAPVPFAGVSLESYQIGNSYVM